MHELEIVLHKMGKGVVVMGNTWHKRDIILSYLFEALIQKEEKKRRIRSIPVSLQSIEKEKRGES